jgi:hypothetical protein
MIVRVAAASSHHHRKAGDIIKPTTGFATLADFKFGKVRQKLNVSLVAERDATVLHDLWASMVYGLLD